MNDAPCPDCHNNNTQVIGKCRMTAEERVAREHSRDPQSDEPKESQLLRCQDCELLFRWPGLCESELNELYQSIPRDLWKYESERPMAWTLALGILLSRLGPASSPSVLDIGAFTGGFLNALPGNWKKSAIEPSPEAAAELKANGIHVSGRFIEDTPTDSYANSFDAITLLDVYEHLPAPRRALQQVTKMLKPGGILLISTGNTSHWTWRLLRGNHWYLHSLQHCSFANKHVLQRALKECGLEIIRFQKHAHAAGELNQQLFQTAEVLFFWTRSRGWFTRKLAGGITRLPRLDHLRHRQLPPFSNTLRDHQLVTAQRS